MTQVDVSDPSAMRCAGRRTSTARSSTPAASAAAPASSSPPPRRGVLGARAADPATRVAAGLDADVPPDRPQGDAQGGRAATASAGPPRSPARRADRLHGRHGRRPAGRRRRRRLVRRRDGVRLGRRLYVATQRWTTSGTYEPGTMIHRFDITDAGARPVRGERLRRRHAAQPVLAVRGQGASCGPRRRAGSARDSESRVTTLQQAAATSSRAARSTASARASGSSRCASSATPATSSRSARPTRSTRSTSATRPTRASRGELKIPGYSAYLHPVGDGLLLGVGQDADASGRDDGGAPALAVRRRRPGEPAAAPAAQARRALLELCRRVGPPRVPVVAGDQARDAAHRQRGVRRRRRVHRRPCRRHRGARADQPSGRPPAGRRRSSGRASSTAGSSRSRTTASAASALSDLQGDAWAAFPDPPPVYPPDTPVPGPAIPFD